MSNLLSALVWLISRLPLGALQRIGWVSGRLALVLSPRFGQKTRNSLKLAGFAENALDYRRLIRDSAAHTGMSALELAAAWCQDTRRVAGMVRACQGWDAVEASVAAGRGLLFITPHLGAYDIAGRYLASRLPVPLTAMFRPPKVKWLQPLMQRGRIRDNGNTAPATPAGVRQIMKALKHGEATIVLPDQVPGSGEGLWVPFFGQWAYTMTLASRLGGMKDVDTYFFYGRRLQIGEGFEVRIRPLSVPFTGDRYQDTRRINAEVEALVREAPEQYLWGYSRFKHPAGADERPTTDVPLE